MADLPYARKPLVYVPDAFEVAVAGPGLPGGPGGPGGGPGGQGGAGGGAGGQGGGSGGAGGEGGSGADAGGSGSEGSASDAGGSGSDAGGSGSDAGGSGSDAGGSGSDGGGGADDGGSPGDNPAVILSYIATQQLIAPVFATQPANLVIDANEGGSFLAAASGYPAYQWQYSPDGIVAFSNVPEGAIFSDTTSGTMLLTNVPRDYDGYVFRCVATNTGGTATSNTATLTVNIPAGGLPYIITDPADATTAPGGAAAFAVVAGGTGPLSYEWQRTIQPVDLVPLHWFPVEDAFFSGNTTANLSVDVALPQFDNRLFRCRVRNAFGTVFSNYGRLTEAVVTEYLTLPTLLVDGTLVPYALEATATAAIAGQTDECTLEARSAADLAPSTRTTFNATLGAGPPFRLIQIQDTITEPGFLTAFEYLLVRAYITAAFGVQYTYSILADVALGNISTTIEIYADDQITPIDSASDIEFAGNSLIGVLNPTVPADDFYYIRVRFNSGPAPDPVTELALTGALQLGAGAYLITDLRAAWDDGGGLQYVYCV